MIRRLAIDLQSSAFTTLRNALRDQFMQAVTSENFERARHLVEAFESVGPDIEDDSGMTLFHWAVSTRNWSVMSFLTEIGADVTGQDGNAALRLAFENRNSPLIRLLIKNGADAERKIRDASFHSALNVSQRNERWIRFLVEIGTDVSGPEGAKAFLFVLETSNLILMRSLVEHGFDINQPILNEQTPLHWAIEQQDLERISFLIDLGAHLDVVSNGHLPLYWAIEAVRQNMANETYSAAISWLESKGERVLPPSPEDSVREINAIGIARFLVQSGASLQDAEPNGRSVQEAVMESANNGPLWTLLLGEIMQMACNQQANWVFYPLFKRQ